MRTRADWVYATRIPKGKVVGRRWRIIRKLGEGGFGAVYKVEEIVTNELAALKAEANNKRGNVLRIEAKILHRLEGKPHVAQLIQTGKKDSYSYIVMTLLGDSLDKVLRRIGRVCSISSQIRIGIQVLFGLKQLHDAGFIHRDVKPGNLALGFHSTEQSRFIHILDFGLAREYIVVDTDGKTKMRRPRPNVRFRGTLRYCSADVQERCEQGRMDDLWCLLYIMVELRGPLPWANFQTLNYYLRPDYLLLYHVLEKIMVVNGIKFSDPFDWENDELQCKFCHFLPSALWSSQQKTESSDEVQDLLSTDTECSMESIEENLFPEEVFALDQYGF
ncbi:hypothetical protein DICVIV_01661 [Dictyocaulus viviparus]|uniref:Protein kinase domain-containing protein n=1 Tax=Dictyocaulus viviparus TaxID=29172 RepID=A0A0D8YCA9_DICVI|nr:hypothetical protein DICVIV_01661 [Dictyocaulus viviparus]